MDQQHRLAGVDVGPVTSDPVTHTATRRPRGTGAHPPLLKAGTRPTSLVDVLAPSVRPTERSLLLSSRGRG